MVDEYFQDMPGRCRDLIRRAMADPFDASDHWRQTVERDYDGTPEYVEKPQSHDEAHEAARSVFEFLSENRDFHKVMKETPEDERKRLTYGVAEIVRYSENRYTTAILKKALDARAVLSEIEKALVTRDKLLATDLDANQGICIQLDELRPRIQDALGVRK